MKTTARRRPITLSQILIVLLCCCAALITIYPMYYVLILSVSNPAEAAKGDIFIWPRGFYTGSYEVIVTDVKMWQSAALSVFYVVAGTFMALLTSVLVAYPLARPNLRFRKAVVIFLIIPMYFGGGLIPSFLLYYNLGLYNTVWAMILPGFGIWNIILVRTYFKTIPSELSDSAQMDGANNFQSLWHIFLPLSKPVLAVIAIYTIVGIWNSWFNALVFLPNKELHPLQLYLQRVLIAQSVDLTKIDKFADIKAAEAMVHQALSARQLKYSMIMFVTLPIIMVYPMFQKHFIKGVMLGSLKG
jgi:putative aldouronate transport system permease protein